MKKLILLPAALLLAANSFADQLHNFDQIKSAVMTGKAIHFVVDYSKCVSSVKNAAHVSYSGTFTPDAVAINNDAGYLATSLMHFTLNNPLFPAKPVYEFVRYTLHNDNTLTIADQALEAATYTPLTNGNMTYTCKIDESATIYG
jgi:hypothetical protein